MKPYFFVFALLMVSLGNISAQSEPTVSNLDARFDDCKSVITFDLTGVASDNPVDLVLMFSPDGGITWLPCDSVTGDLFGMSDGTGYTITWNNSAENIRYGYVLFKVYIPPIPDPDCTIIFTTGTPLDMIYVKGGTFQMGCEQAPPGWSCQPDEVPIHEVTLSSFCIGKYEVTRKQWFDIMGSYPPAITCFLGDALETRTVPNFHNDAPVYNVSWNDVQVFIDKLNYDYPGMGYRLPTEAEWEYAARGGKHHSPYMYSGSDNYNDVAWNWDDYSPATPVTQHQIGDDRLPNALGIYNMSGNVWEFCSDFYSATYYTSSPLINPKGPPTGSERVYRGGGFASASSGLYVSWRASTPQNKVSCDIGFRLVCTPPPSNH